MTIERVLGAKDHAGVWEEGYDNTTTTMRGHLFLRPLHSRPRGKVSQWMTGNDQQWQ